MITEQQFKVVKVQLDRISKLKKVTNHNHRTTDQGGQSSAGPNIQTEEGN